MGHARHLPAVAALPHIGRKKSGIPLLLPVKPGDPLPGRLLLPERRRKRGPAFRVLSQIQVKGQKLPVQRFPLWILSHRKIQKRLIAVRSGRTLPEQPLFLIKLRKPLKHGKRGGETLLQHRQGMGELSAVVIQLHHLLHPLQRQNVTIGKPAGEQHLIGRKIRVPDPVSRRHFLHMGALQHLQETQLQLIRPAGAHIVKGPPEAFHVLLRQAGDQIQVDMDVPSLPQPPHVFLKPRPVRGPPDRPQGVRIGGLHADLQLQKAGTKAPKQLQLLLRQNIRRDLKMEIGDAVVMLPEITPDLHGMGMAAVKGAVHELDLRHPFIQKKLKLLLHPRRIPETHRFINGGQTVAAAVRAAPAGFIIDDPVPKRIRLPVFFIKKRDLIQQKQRPLRRPSDPAAGTGAEGDSPDFFRIRPKAIRQQAARFFRQGGPDTRIQLYQLPEGFLPFSDHDARR